MMKGFGGPIANDARCDFARISAKRDTPVQQLRQRQSVTLCGWQNVMLVVVVYSLSFAGLPSSQMRALVVLALVLGTVAAVTGREARKPVSLPAGQWELLDYDPVANPAAIVTSGFARFTVLTDRLIRCEWAAEAGQWVDQATIAILNRNLTVPAFTTSEHNGILSISTASVLLSYTIGENFTAETLTVHGLDPSSNFVEWQYGQTNNDVRNLLGTIKSLDELDVISLNCTENANVYVHGELLHCEWALFSRDGWAIVDDSTNYVLDSTDFWTGPTPALVDTYVFAHGLDYVGALQDFIAVAGRIAMMPRYSSGIWWSRWYDIGNTDVRSIVAEYSSRQIPLDVFILDMDWHTKYGWGGYTFDPYLFPYPSDTMAWLHNVGLHVGANLHDDDGVRPQEVMYNQMCSYLDLDPTTYGTIPFNLINDTWCYALEDVVLKYDEDLGMDFWWIDWQQGGQGGGCTGEKQNPTIWTDRLRSTDHLRRGEPERGLVLARWGGLGSHRYQVGFSGDVNQLDWTDLAFQPYFSLTASNVGYGFWSHDIVGDPVDFELNTRWLQWGAYSGTMRTHDRGGSGGTCADDVPVDCWIVEIWKNPTPYFDYIRNAFQNRAALLPYIYTATRTAFDTGVSLLRPMYYDWPAQDSAYLATPTAFGQYMFGPDMLVAPIITPMNTTSQLTVNTVWLPPGVWIEQGTGVWYESGESSNSGSQGEGLMLTKGYDLSEIPIFIRGGAVLATRPIAAGASGAGLAAAGPPPSTTIGLAQQQYDALVFTIYPGADQGETSVYEDDGLTTAYLQGQYAWTTASYQRTATATYVNVLTEGAFPELPAFRSYTVRLVNAILPDSVVVNGVALSFARFGGPSTWHYCGSDATVVVDCGIVPTSTELLVEIIIASDPAIDQLLNGTMGMIEHGVLAKLNLDFERTTLGSNTPPPPGGMLMSLSTTGDALSYLAGANPSEFIATLKGLPQLYNNAIDEVNGLAGQSGVNLDRLAYSQALLANVFFQA